MKLRKRVDGADFFPAWDVVNNRPLVSREAVNARLQEVLGSMRTSRSDE